MPDRAARSGSAPGIVLALLVACSGVSPASAETVVLEAGASMTYLANTADPGIDASWFLPDFVEGPGWSAGTYGIGYDLSPPGSGAHALIRTEIPGPVDSVYTRATFEVADAASVFSLFFGEDYDDGTVVWINGVEVYRSPEMRGAQVAWNTVASAHESSNGAAPDYRPLRDVSEAGIPALHDGENVLAVGVWNHPDSFDDLLLVPTIVVNRMLTRGPYLQRATPEGIVVRWRTGAPTVSRVLFGTAPDQLVEEVAGAGETTEHEIALTGLSPGTRYYYAVATSEEILAGADGEHFFDTPSAAGMPKPTRAWVLGDSGLGNVDAVAVREAYAGFPGAGATDLMIMLGDNAYPQGTQIDYQQNLFDIFAAQLRRTVLWPAIGNHDLFDSSTETWPYYDIFTLPEQAEAGGVASGTESYYSFDHGNVHFVALDSMDVTEVGFGTAMLAWLEADLANTTEDWIIAFWHHPPYSKGGHDSDDPADSSGRLIWMRQNAVPVLEDYGVDLVLAGHSHSYERSCLIDGHYGDSSSFVESMKKDPGDGNESGPDGAYVKPYRGGVPYPAGGDGAIYTVAGSASHLTPGVGVGLGGTEPDHPAMIVSSLTLGSVVLDVNGNRLDAIFLDDTGSVLDAYTIFKGSPTVEPTADFVAEPRIGTAPASIEFTDLTVGGPTTWGWDVDDDGTLESTLPDPVLELSDPGVHSVRLAVSNSAGADERLRTAYVCIVSGVPGAIGALAFGPDPSVFSWGAGAHATAYDVVRGDLAGLLAGELASTDLTCLENDDIDQLAQDPAQPEPGRAYFYLVGGANCAGEQGTYDPPGTGGPSSRDDLVHPVCRSCATGADDDGDGVCLSEDNCPALPNPGQEDADADGAGDACDGCPFDPAKAEPGACGCGESETDTDFDGTPDCVDGCVADPNKTEPGECGCGVGDCWLLVSSGTSETLESVMFLDASPTGYVAGESGTLLKTIDGGATWQAQSVPTEENLETVAFLAGALTGYVVGDAGVLFGTVDGGEHWTPLESGNDRDLRGVQVIPGTATVYVVGKSGTILKTTDGGDTWVQQPSGTSITLESVHFPANASTGWVVGKSGIILKTVDGGATWLQQASPTEEDLEDVYFPEDLSTGYAVGDGGTLLKTNDGGLSWFSQDSLTTAKLRGISFPLDAVTGYVVGSSGTIRTTVDGGWSWQPAEAPTGSGLRDVQFPADLTEGYVVGSGGTIIKRVVE